MHLETKGNYPHNGLAGFAFDALGNMFFGFGENLGADYKIIGSDGTTLSGGGEGGNLYRCKPDGSKLERWATGFWNPHASCFDAFGRLFTVDNDPDSRPPCRLLHIIPGGDYGYRFRNGRKGTHPFTSWNGEIPGTLPMVAGTGEAPSGIVCYENDGFPEDYLGTLLVGSWGDHRIDQFVLEPKGASFTSKAKPIIQGGENFRPVGLAVAPDGSLFFSDWVLKDYKLHGKGRVWRVSAVKSTGDSHNDIAVILKQSSTDLTAEYLSSQSLAVRRMAAVHLDSSLEGREKIRELRQEKWIGSRRQFELLWVAQETIGFDLDFSSADFHDPFDVASSIYSLSDPDPQISNLLVSEFLNDRQDDNEPEFQRLILLLAARNRLPKEIGFPLKGLRDTDFKLRFAAVQWVGEENLTDLRPDVEALLADPTTTPDLFLACLATLQLLDGKPASEFEKQPPMQYVAAMVKDSSRPTALRATALRMLPVDAPELDAALLSELLSSNDVTLRTEAVRTLAGSPLPKARSLLLPIAADSHANIELRAEAIAGLCNGPHELPLPGDIEALLTQYARGDIDVELNDTSQKRRAIETLQLEALRSLRGRAVDGSKIHEAIKNVEGTADVKEALGIALNGKREADPQTSTIDPQPADPVAGRRVFYSHNGPLCAKCHMVQGRGGQVGPDLTVIARTMDREKLLASILKPSQEIAPQFTTWVIETAEGKTHTGFILEDNRTGQIKLGSPTGEIVLVNEADIETRAPSKTSVMPEKLHQQMTTQELRDLLAFLETLK